MDDGKLDRLIKDGWKVGWKVGTVADFLELSSEEEIFIELKLLLSDRLKQVRESQNPTQKAVAKRIDSSQSRVAKMEAGDPSVSMDLLVRSLLALGATPKDIADAIALVT
ncbi:Transcriptional regulator, XRE family [Tumidithrix helvetica PCC 7403]|uniref:helix-turn-helix domain-containing protein n=1 Tax=Tumidithrix helvetica TaxID=3457545 RepID=UPI003C8AE597